MLKYSACKSHTASGWSSRPDPVWDQNPAPASGDSLAEATMAQSPFFVLLPSLIKLAKGVIGF